MRQSDRPVIRVAAVETCELRWFAEGARPERAMSWFTVDGRRGEVETRHDLYLVDGRSDVGVKLRGRETLELKVRRSVRDGRAGASGPAGRIEVWQKWSPADAHVDVPTNQSWIQVRKRIVRRRFTVEGQEVELTGGERSMAGEGCDVEIAALEVGGVVAWTFAFAAFGPVAARHTSIATAWRSLRADGAPFGGSLDFDLSCGYPEWLARHADPTRIVHIESEDTK